MIRFYKDESTSTWKTHVAASVEPWNVEGWALPNLPGLITDFVISLNDKYLYLSNWLQGDIRQYDISDPAKPKLVGQLYLGGVAREGSSVFIVDSKTNEKRQIKVPTIIDPKTKQEKQLQGGPQMIQLSLDGKRLYVTNSLFSAWDQQFYPDMVQKGSYLLQIDVDTEKGGLSVNNNFFIDFGNEPYGPALAHEVRYVGGDCTSDIWL